MPDGCPEVVLNLADRFVRVSAQGQWDWQPRSMLVGQLTQAVLVGPSGVTDIVGIRFLPWGASLFLKTPMSELRDAMLPLDSVVAGGMESLADRLSTAPAKTWADHVFSHLLDQMADHGPGVGLSSRAVAEIGSGAGRLSVVALARRLHVGERHLERVMRQEVGLPPVVLRRIFRVQAALRLMRAGPRRPLTDVALEAGFYDHSHFTREFRRVVGRTPSQFMAAELDLSHHFIGEALNPDG